MSAPSTLCIRRSLSAVHRGMAFEQRSLAILQRHLSMSLTSVGGKEDGGIDLLGWWWLPQSPRAPGPDIFGRENNKPPPEPRRRIRVVAQCKAEKKRVSPKYVRELEGVLHRFVADTRIQSNEIFPLSTSVASPFIPLELDALANQIPPPSTVALLISESAFTQSTILRAMSSPIPFLLLHLPPVANSVADLEGMPDLQMQSPFGSAILNKALCGKDGLLEGKAEVRWERSRKTSKTNDDPGRFGLWWEGKKLTSWIPF